MLNRFRLILPLVLVALLLAACGGAAPAGETTSNDALPGTATARAANAALTPDPTATDNPLGGSARVPAGRDASGAYFLGDANAPVVVTDHSDFL